MVYKRWIFITVCLIIVLISYLLYAEDVIETVGGDVFTGKIVREDSSQLFLEMKSGTIAIKKNMIKNMKLEQKWGIEDHVNRIGVSPEEKPEKEEVIVQQEKELVTTSYFPLKEGNWWKYKVHYKPDSLYGESLPDFYREYELTWQIKGTVDSGQIYLSTYSLHGSKVYRLILHRSDNTESDVNKVLFVGSRKDDEDSIYIIMTDEQTKEKFIFYQRMMPINPFLKTNKTWVDVGQENETALTSYSKVISIEGIDTPVGYFDDCIVVEKVNAVENQTLQTRSYWWFAPQVGLVKMVQEVMYPQVESGELTKSFIFQEYELIDYEVK